MTRMRRTDPVFRKRTPLLFAHRGGVREKPESTEMAFNWAKKVGADVLELDIQVSKDDQFVVWHGPKLDNVRIEGQRGPRRRRKKEITDYLWSELENKAWVANPHPDPDHKFSDKEIARVPTTTARQLLSLEAFLTKYRHEPLNIELKSSIDNRHLRPLIQLLNRHRGKRTIVLASQDYWLLRWLRRFPERYPTGLSILGNIWLLLDLSKKDLPGIAVQTSYGLIQSKEFVSQLKARGCAVHVFLTGFGFLLPALDERPGTPKKADVFRILDLGVDGIMTDRPYRVRKLMDEWSSQKRSLARRSR